MLAIRPIQLARFAGRAIAICLALIACTGCRERPTTVSGSVTLDGQPLSIGNDARGTVVFHPVGGQGTTSTAVLDSSGHFRLATGASSVIAPGKYQVAVSVVRLLPKSENAEQGAERITPPKFATAAESGIKANVTPGENNLHFDLESPPHDDATETATEATTRSDGSESPQPNGPKE